jgi:SAM-dependent methyltransferase
MRLVALDVADRIAGRHDDLTPPRRAIEEIGGFDFREIGRQLADLAIRHGQLAPDGHVIDAGCGYGRLAVPLAPFLTAGSYTGFDISRQPIRWCRSHIGSRFPRFRFHYLDIRNAHYNRRGRIEPAGVVWPAENATATLVLAASLFTHLTDAAARHYVREAARILRPGGRCIASFFLINDESRPRIEAQRTEPKLQLLNDDIAVQDVNDHEAAIAYGEGLVRDMFHAAGFRIVDVLYGMWCQRSDAATYQDFVIAERI